MFNNIGIRSGMVSEAKIAFEFSGERRYLRFGRRVKLIPATEQKMAFQLTQSDFQELIPPFPVHVPPSGNSMELIECFADDSGLIPVDKQGTCIIEVVSGKGKVRETRFPFLLTSKDSSLSSQSSIRWIKVT